MFRDSDTDNAPSDDVTQQRDILLTMTQSPYFAASQIPLIQSPSLRVPRPVELPPDIHPLPDSVNAYFVYPFTLEPHIVTLESSRRNTLTSQAARHDANLQSREEEKERRKRDALRKIAPGFEPHGGPLVPSVKQNTSTLTRRGSGEPGTVTSPAIDVMDDLVDKLAALDERNSGILSSPPR